MDSSWPILCGAEIHVGLGPHILQKQNENIKNPRNDLKNHYKRNHDAISIKCNTNFSQNCDLELHLQSEHNTEKKFKCDKCEMRFVLKWRLQKHAGIHEEKNISNMKYCHYFNNNRKCPFETLGCMFKHENTPQCRYIGKCYKDLCPFKHNQKEGQSICEKTKFFWT